MSLPRFIVHRTEPRCQVPEQPSFPYSWVKVLRDGDELHDAVAQAIEFEKEIINRTSARVGRYEELDGVRRPALPEMNKSVTRRGRRVVDGGAAQQPSAS
jgi:hypothetical protein